MRTATIIVLHIDAYAGAAIGNADRRTYGRSDRRADRDTGTT